MKRFFSGLWLVLSFVVISAQQDSIYIEAKISPDKKQISVVQEIIYTNNSDADISKISLLNWIAAYKNRNTPLVKRKLEDRKNELYFAKPNEIGGLQNLQISLDEKKIFNIDSASENIEIPLEKPLKKGEKIIIKGISGSGLSACFSTVSNISFLLPSLFWNGVVLNSSSFSLTA